MKKQLLGFILGASTTFLLAFKATEHIPNEATAEVKKIDGFYIFTDSRPVMPFDSLGLVDRGFITGAQYESIKSNLIKRARKRHPNADGLILYLTNVGIDKCVVVKFK